jgi:tRNA (guanine37-N1)-methyltransferase
VTRFATALVHHPCLDKAGDVYTTSITNLDVHDLARSSRTYDAAAFYIVTPVTAQQDLARAIAEFWERSKRATKVPSRAAAMKLVRVVSSLEEAIAAETEAAGASPLVISTSARDDDPDAITAPAMRERMAEEPAALVVFGTGYGLAPQALELCDIRLTPVHGAGEYNHLSVRSAAAIVLDRLRSPDR